MCPLPVHLERAGSWGEAAPSTPLGPGPEAPAEKCSFACYAENTRRRKTRVLMSPQVSFWVYKIHHLFQRILSFKLVAISRMPGISPTCISGHRSSWRAPAACRRFRLPSWRLTPPSLKGGPPAVATGNVPRNWAWRGVVRIIPREIHLVFPFKISQRLFRYAGPCNFLCDPRAV